MRPSFEQSRERTMTEPVKTVCQIAEQVRHIVPLLKGPEQKWFSDYLKTVVIPLIRQAENAG